MLTGCFGSKPETVKLASIVITPGNMSAATGTSLHLTATGIYTNAIREDISNLVTWASDNTAIATVNANGNVESITAGVAILTASLNGITSAGARLNVDDLSFKNLIFPNWGPVTIADNNQDNIYETLGTTGTATEPTSVPINQGIGSVLLSQPGLVLRDLRYADFDNDGVLDVIFNVFSEDNPNSYIQLYWGNPDGTFSLDNFFSTNKFSGFGETIVVADFDNDGFLDIFIPQYQTGNGPYSRNLLFKNGQTRTFSEVALISNVGFSRVQPEGAQAVDFDFDGLIDLYVGGSLYKNLGGLSFSDISVVAGLPEDFDEGAKFFDYNSDGNFDLLIHTLDGPRLFISDINQKFTEVTDIFPPSYFFKSYGMNLGDVDGDGEEDVLLAGGWDEFGNQRAPRLWLNRAGKYIDEYFIVHSGAFSDLVSFGDLDNNGSLDITLRYGNNVTLLNNKIPNSYIKVSVLDNGFHNQQGRVVKALYSNGKTKAFVIDGGSGYLSIQPYPILVANNSSQNISFTVYCSNKTLGFSAIQGSYNVDCTSSTVVRY